VGALIAMIAVAYGAALGTAIGLVVGIGLGGVTLVAVIRSSPVIEISTHHIRCGRAELPRDRCEHPRLVAGHEVATIRRGQDPTVGDRVYQVLPPWFAKSAVLLSVVDPEDPHSAWLIASRHPDAVLSAISTQVSE